MRRPVLALALTPALLGSACASGAHLHAVALPGADLSRYQRIYVEHREGDSRQIEDDIRDQLREVGRDAESGSGAPQEDFDAVVSYIDRYLWDISMYCVQLTLYVRDEETGNIVATGSSFRPSLVRKTPAGHARLIVRELFGGAPE